MQPGPLRLIPLEEQPVVPWRNGGGRTREVAVARDPGGDGFRWRISVAQVDRDGPFSMFPGIDRTIWLLSGAGMVLSVEGVEHRLDARLAPFRFRGEDRVHARLVDGPTEDLNVMVERATTTATARVLTVAKGSGMTMSANDEASSVLLVLAGGARFESPVAVQELTAGDAMGWDGWIAARVVGIDRERTDLLWCSFAPREVES